MNPAEKLEIDPKALQRLRGRDYRLPLVLLLTVLLAVYFWTGSRYPALSEKAMMGGDTPLSGLSFDIAIELIPGSSFLAAIWVNTVNWLFTNMKGMTFGVLFGAMALTLLSLLQKRSFKNAFANSALGAVIGAPLGVCVNCAVPIALGLHAGRLRLETTLSAMLASPTLNVIVVTMSFALLPIHVAAVKLFASLMMVLVGVPLVCRFILRKETEATIDARAATAVGQKLGGLSGWLMRKLTPSEFEAGEYGIGATLTWFGRTYGRNLIFIAMVTVPMMFAAAVLGALFVEVFSPSTMAGLLPRGNLAVLFIAMLLVAVFLSFAPAPIALDVILTAVIIALGVPEFYGAAAVVALGSFSVYAFIILWRAISLRTAISLWLLVIAASVCAGLLAHRLEPLAQKYTLDGYRSILAEGQENWPEAPDTEPAQTLAELRPRIDARRVETNVIAYEQSGAPVQSVSMLPLSAPTTPARSNGRLFDRVVGRDLGIGITQPLHSLSSTMLHLFEGGVAAGDFHGDGWPDLVLRKSYLDSGLAIYANIEGRFVRQRADLGAVDSVPVLSFALVDVNGDNALDLVVSTSGSGNYIFWNRQGGFDQSASLKLPGDDRSATQSLAFADFDRDGRLDIALGNAAVGMASAGLGSRFAAIQKNKILLNRGDGDFTVISPDAYPGQTLTLLASDFDRNGTIDLLAGDDVAPTDEFALFDSGGRHKVARGSDVPFPFQMRTSMSYDEGDYNNDLVPDYYGGQIAARDRQFETEAQLAFTKRRCEQVAVDSGWNPARTKACIADLSEVPKLFKAYQGGLESGCAGFRDPVLRRQCATNRLLRHYGRRRSEGPNVGLHRQCRLDLAGQKRSIKSCNTLLVSVSRRAPLAVIANDLGPVYNDANILLTGSPDGRFIENAKQQGVRHPGWTWDARFTDLDQDGWQDLLVLTGFGPMVGQDTSNTVYQNRKGNFVEATENFGMIDFLPSLSAARLDLDRDGDIDLVGSLSGPNVIVHRNVRPNGKALWIHLRQSGGNSMAIGARVTICVDGETEIRPGKCQVRPIKASGGFQSFDPIAAHFGLGAAREVSLIAVEWPDGKRSLIRPVDVDHGELVITRAAA